MDLNRMKNMFYNILFTAFCESANYVFRYDIYALILISLLVQIQAIINHISGI